MNSNLLQRALNSLNSASGKRFTLSERLPGKSGAWAVDALDGELGILKVYNDSSCAAVMQTVQLVEHLRAAGYPTPRPLHYGSLTGGGCFYLHERVPGHPMRSPGIYSELNRHELDRLLRVLNLHAGIAPQAAQDWTDLVEAVALHQQGEWAMVAQSPLPVLQELLERCASRCAQLGHPAWRHDDLVIGDFGPHNVLLNDHSEVAAVFDLDGAGRGDRVIDMVGLLYVVELKLLPVVRDAALQVATPAAFTACGVYWIVHRLYHGIRGSAANLASTAERMLAHFDLLT